MISEAEIRSGPGSALAGRPGRFLEPDYSWAGFWLLPYARRFPEIVVQRRQEYELDWKRRLDYLIPDSDAVTFEEAWQSTMDVIRRCRM
jgi:hypothetical protein